MVAILRGREVTRQGVADIFGISLPTVDSWVRAGCPFLQKGGRGQEWQFNTSQISKWLQERAVDEATGDVPDDIDQLKIRKAKAETELAELELAEKRGEVALIAEFERAQAMAFGAIRTNILNVPQRAVLQLLGETDERVFKEKLKVELILALETSAESDLDDEDDE